MKLTFDQIKAITCGTVLIEQTDGGVQFHRFTQAQRDMYELKSKDNFFKKCFATAGVKLSFRTDSKNLGLKVLTKETCMRTYMSFDVFVNGSPVGYLDNYADLEIPKDYSVEKFPLGAYEKVFDLGEGFKTVTVHLPWNTLVILRELTLDEGAAVEPVKPAKKLLAFGDSITQGFDALRPSRRYISQLAEALDAEEINKAIGGECFCPDLAELKDELVPDYITVAYGTNDWSKTSHEFFLKQSRSFFLELRKQYPGAKIYALTPIWRSNEQTLAKTREPFSAIEAGIRAAIADLDNVTVIPGYDLVPHGVEYFGDYGLHPRNEGFDHYFKNIMKAIG